MDSCERVNQPQIPKHLSVQLENRFATPLQDPGSLSDYLDNLVSSQRMVRAEHKSRGKRLRGKPTTGPQNLIVCDLTVKDVRKMCNENTKILCFPKDLVSDMTEGILHIVTAHPAVKNIKPPTGTNDVVKQQTEMLKRDCDMLITVSEWSGVDQWSSTSSQRRS